MEKKDKEQKEQNELELKKRKQVKSPVLTKNLPKAPTI
jgi:hypothetical protein